MYITEIASEHKRRKGKKMDITNNPNVKKVLDFYSEEADDDVEMSEILLRDEFINSGLSREDKIWLLKYAGDWDFATGNITVDEKGDIVEIDGRKPYPDKQPWQQRRENNDFSECEILVAHINTGGVITNLDTLSSSFVCDCVESINRINGTTSDFFSNGVVTLENNVDVKNFLNSIYNSLSCTHPMHFMGVGACDMVILSSPYQCVAFECDNFGINRLSDKFTGEILNNLQPERKIALDALITDAKAISDYSAERTNNPKKLKDNLNLER